MDSEHNIPNKNSSESSIIRSLKRKGYSERKIASYLRGWRMAGNNRSKE